MLEDRFTLLLANAQHMQAVPGRKTDITDAEWIADLLRHALLRPGFVPERGQRELRELVRYRTSLVQERTAANRLQKVLEGANIKLASVATDVLGRSGREMLQALVAGQGDPTVLADLARGRLREKRPALERALAGRFGPHQQFLVGELLTHIDVLDEAIGRLSAEIAERERAWEPTLERLDSIPGVGRRIAEIVLAEVGPAVARFPSAAHLASWAGLCPGLDESAGKRRPTKGRKGNRWLRGALVEAAHAATHTKTYLAAQFRRLAARRGPKKAMLAPATPSWPSSTTCSPTSPSTRNSGPRTSTCASARPSPAASNAGSNASATASSSSPPLPPRDPFQTRVLKNAHFGALTG